MNTEKRFRTFMNSSIQRIDNRIVVSGELYDFHGFLAQIHAIVEKLGYRTRQSSMAR